MFRFCRDAQSSTPAPRCIFESRHFNTFNRKQKAANKTSTAIWIRSLNDAAAFHVLNHWVLRRVTSCNENTKCVHGEPVVKLRLCSLWTLNHLYLGSRMKQTGSVMGVRIEQWQVINRLRYVNTLLVFLSLLSALLFPEVLSTFSLRCINSSKYFTSCLWRLTYFTETSEVLAADSEKPQVFSISGAPVSSSARLNEWIARGRTVRWWISLI